MSLRPICCFFSPVFLLIHVNFIALVAATAYGKFTVVTSYVVSFPFHVLPVVKFDLDSMRLIRSSGVSYPVESPQHLSNRHLISTWMPFPLCTARYGLTWRACESSPSVCFKKSWACQVSISMAIHDYCFLFVRVLWKPQNPKFLPYCFDSKLWTIISSRWVGSVFPNVLGCSSWFTCEWHWNQLVVRWWTLTLMKPYPGNLWGASCCAFRRNSPIFLRCTNVLDLSWLDIVWKKHEINVRIVWANLYQLYSLGVLFDMVHYVWFINGSFSCIISWPCKKDPRNLPWPRQRQWSLTIFFIKPRTLPET